jgi:beta-galactosidase/beta-glucuronidase
MRSLNWTTGDGTLRLNGQPYFQALLLDQGYWPKTLMTPPSPTALKADIELSKAMGFNGCRKHQKVEDPVFMYWADKLGFLVWGEMASAYRFSLEYVDRFDQEWMEMVNRDINHPCVVAWTIANESWGYPDLGNNVSNC